MTDVAELRGQLRAAGLRVTRTRIAVVDALQGLGGHPTADEVSDALAANGVQVSRATVFNALDDLTQAGMVMVADAGSGATRYEKSTVWHHHFVCGVCGTISDVPCPDDAPLCVAPTGIDGIVDDAQVIFRGTCRNCLSARG